MNPFQNFDWSFKSIAKVLGMALLAVFALSVAIGLVTFAFRTIFNGPISYDERLMATESAQYGGDMDYFQNAKMGLMPSPMPDYSTGNSAEEFEVKTYSGTIQTRKLEETCETIANLKEKTYVIFENSDKNDDYCYYRFKVEKDKAEEIVKIIEDLDPKTFNANIQSIRAQVEGTEDELTILNKKLVSVEETLEDAQSAYDEISDLATRQKDAVTLAQIIESKLNLIERLSTQRLEIKEQIDRYSKAKSDQLDQLNYTFFDINVYKDLIMDWKELKDSWKYQAKEMVRNINSAFQDVTLNLVVYFVRFAEGVLYLFLSVFLLKFVWLGVKRVWQAGPNPKRK